MALLLSAEVRGFADRRLVLVDASDYMDDVADLPMRTEHSPGLAPPGPRGCWLQSDTERDLTIHVNVHAGPDGVPLDGYEHAEFSGGGKTLAVRGLFGDPFAVLGVRAIRWHLAATYFQDKAYWRLHLWDVEPG